MSASPPLEPARRAAGWQLVFLLLGLALLVALVVRVGWRSLLAQAVGIGWYFAAIVALFGGVHLLRALSWRLCLNEPGRAVPFRSLWGLWLAGEAVSNLSFWWSGEAFRVMTTRQAVSLDRALSAQLILRALYAYASLWWVVVGLLLMLWVVPGHGVLYPIMLVATLAAIAALLLGTAALVAQGEGIGRLARWVEPYQGRHRRLERALRFLRVLQNDLASLVGGDRRRLATLLGWNLLAALAGVAEVYLVLRGLGVEVSIAGAAVIEALNKLLGVFAYVVPGNIGVREAGNVLIVQLFGLAAVTGINLALIRRARTMVWVAVGAWLVLRHGLSLRAVAATPLAESGAEKVLR